AHVLAMKERLEDGVAEAKRQQVLHRLLAEVMVDPVDLLGTEKSQEIAVEPDRAGEVVAEGLLDDDARPGKILVTANQSRAGQAFHDRTKKLWIRREVEQAIAGQIPLALQIVQPPGQSLHALGRCKIGTLVCDVRKEL